MNKKGFTLVEILVVIAVLAILIVLTVPAITGSSKKAKEKTYQTKVALIESSAILFGQDNYGNIVAKANASTTKCTYKTSDTDDKIKICDIMLKDLVPDYVSADNERTTNMIDDPRKNDTYLDEKIITITVDTKTRTVKARMNE